MPLKVIVWTGGLQLDTAPGDIINFSFDPFEKLGHGSVRIFPPCNKPYKNINENRADSATVTHSPSGKWSRTRRRLHPGGAIIEISS